MLISWKKSYDQPRQHSKKQRHHFTNKGTYSQSYGFSSSYVWMWELNHKKAEHWRIDAFELWCCTRFLRIPWTARSKQSILKEISPEYSLEGCWSWSSNTLTTWCEELAHWKRPWYWERSKAGGEGGDRGWDGWMASPTQWTWVWASSRSWWRIGKPGVLQFMGLQRVRHDWATELNWIHNKIIFKTFYSVLQINKQCDDFRWTAKGLSHAYTCIHSPLLSRVPHTVEQSSIEQSSMCIQ